MHPINNCAQMLDSSSRVYENAKHVNLKFSFCFVERRAP